MEIHLGSPYTPQEWDAYFLFRWQMLRQPWKQPVGSDRDQHETAAFHIMATTPAGEIVGIGRLHSVDNETAQIRYMAVAPDFQRRGIGRSIITCLEAQACTLGYKKIILNARNPSLAFYASNGYMAIEPGHTLYDSIPHTKMQKPLNC